VAFNRNKTNFDVLLTVLHLSIFISVINQLDAQTFCFTISLFHASTCFEHYVLIIWRSKLHYTASGIIKPIGGRLVHRLREDWLECIPGGRGSTVVNVLCYKSEDCWFDPSWCHWNFSLTLTSHYGPGVDSVSNRNEYQEHFLGGKGGRCVRLTTLPPSCAIVVKSGNLNFLGPPRPPLGRVAQSV